MKLKLIGIAAGSVALLAVAAVAWKVLTVTDPYVVTPLTSSPAPIGATVGYSVQSTSRMLSVISSNEIVVVSDPGVSFKYEVLWLVDRPRKDRSSSLMEYRFPLPEYASADHINPIGTQLPQKIQQVAQGGQW